MQFIGHLDKMMPQKKVRSKNRIIGMSIGLAIAVWLVSSFFIRWPHAYIQLSWLLLIIPFFVFMVILRYPFRSKRQQEIQAIYERGKEIERREKEKEENVEEEKEEETPTIDKRPIADRHQQTPSSYDNENPTHYRKEKTSNTGKIVIVVVVAIIIIIGIVAFYSYDKAQKCQFEKENLLGERGIGLSAAVTTYNLQCASISGPLTVTHSSGF